MRLKSLDHHRAWIAILMAGCMASGIIMAKHGMSAWLLLPMAFTVLAGVVLEHDKQRSIELEQRALNRDWISHP